MEMYGMLDIGLFDVFLLHDNFDGLLTAINEMLA